jgi:predicted nucleic acid-binding protein
VPDIADTCVVVRYLTDDPPEMAARAEALIEASERLVLPEVVLVETAHVSRSLYGVGCDEALGLLIDLLLRHNITLQSIDKETALAALHRCRGSGRVSIPDALIWAAARQSSPSVVYSFDRRFPSEEIDRGSRRRTLPEIRERSRARQALGERLAMDSVVRGSAADGSRPAASVPAGPTPRIAGPQFLTRRIRFDTLWLSRTGLPAFPVGRVGVRCTSADVNRQSVRRSTPCAFPASSGPRPFVHSRKPRRSRLSSPLLPDRGEPAPPVFNLMIA